MARLPSHLWPYEGVRSGRAARYTRYRQRKALYRQAVRPGKVRQTDRPAPPLPADRRRRYKYGLSSSLLLNLTGNTDFADTEVDLQPFNITPFKVYLPEKRGFFLENAGVFNFPLGDDQDQLFFSRQIGIDSVTANQVPVNVGAKLTGTVGR